MTIFVVEGVTIAALIVIVIVKTRKIKKLLKGCLRKEVFRMTAIEIEPHQWFYWGNDWRIFERLEGGVKKIEGQDAVPVRPLQPTAMNAGGYIPTDSIVKLHGLPFVKLMERKNKE